MNMVPAGELSEVQENKSIPLITEERGMRSAQGRHQTAQSYRSVFGDAAQRIVERETNNIRRAAKKHLAERSLDNWQEWLNDFYRDFQDFMSRQIAPAVYGLTEAIQAIAAGEVGSDAGMTPEIDKFMRSYINAFSLRYTDSSRGQLEALVRESEESGEDMIAVVETRLGEWEDTRPGKVGMNETVQLSNAIAKVVFAGAGITKLIWRTMGSKACPICQEMNGKVVGIEQPFVGKDTVLESEGQSPMRVYRPTSHPPLHQSCICTISPG